MKAAAVNAISAFAAVCAQLAPAPSFEVASIRKVDGPLSRIGDYSASGTRLTLGGYNIWLLVMEAYGLRNYRVSFSSTRAAFDDYYNVTGKAPGLAAPSREEFRQMLKSLLAERFQLKAHLETRKIPVYALVVDRNGPSLKAASGEGRCATRIGPVNPEDRNYRYQYANCALDSLVNSLATDLPVIDKTGLNGRYDISLLATPWFKMRDSPEPGDIPVESAIRQLGLRLEPRKEPIEVLVVDHVEKPTEN